MSDIKNKWIAVWGCAMLTAGPNETPKNPALTGATLRQQIRPTLGGEKLRLVISNEYGKCGLEIESMKIAKLPDPESCNVDLNTEAVITYNGETRFVVPAGERITTDVINYEFSALGDLAVTMKLGSVSDVLTSHTASRCSTWIKEGNHVSDNNFDGCEVMTSWYFIAELDTMADDKNAVIVTLGDSLTDGASCTTNSFSRYSDELARKIQANDNMKHLAVVGMGIGGTALYRYGGEIAGTNRMNRDVLGVPGVKYCILMMGVNDIGGVDEDISENIIREYKSITERCRKNGIKIFASPITPNKGSGYYSEHHEKTRLKVNEFVLSEEAGFDGIINFAEAVASKDDPAKMDESYVSVWHDYLHFNDSGYIKMGETAYEFLENYIIKEK